MVDRIISVTDENFHCFISKNPYVIVDFGASWCGFCRALIPTMEMLAEKYRGKVAFGTINIDGNTQISEHFKIMTIPTLLFFRDGALIDTAINPTSKSFIENKIASLIQ
ncbi:MAG: thiol reductase thioredoxin [Candidatus Bathyarchaeota archaeon]|nr:MAG: thiol reductase thioredoxin [Candidatus Bathyarchaeota archaeon]